MSLSVDLRCRLPDFTLDAAFEADAGITAIFGPSGSGKTTLINAVAGMLRPDDGRIALDGDVLFGPRVCLPPHRRRIGYVFQDARLFPHLTVRQNLLYGRFFARSRAAPDRVIEMLGLGGLLRRRPARLSGGEKQRVAIGRALLSAPRLLLMDEPLAALDDARKAEILPYLERLRAEGLPILYVSHSVAEVTRLAARIVVLDAGRVRAIRTPAAFLGDPASGLAPRDTGSIIAAQVTAHEEDGLTRVETPAGPLLIRTDAAVGQRLNIRINAQDVILSTRPPEGLSALNILPVEVAAIRAEGDRALVDLRAGDAAIVARITQRSVSALGLRTGMPCYAILKSVAVDQSFSGGGSEGTTTGVSSARSR